MDKKTGKRCIIRKETKMVIREQVSLPVIQDAKAPLNVYSQQLTPRWLTSTWRTWTVSFFFRSLFRYIRSINLLFERNCAWLLTFSYRRSEPYVSQDYSARTYEFIDLGSLLKSQRFIPALTKDNKPTYIYIFIENVFSSHARW